MKREAESAGSQNRSQLIFEHSSCEDAEDRKMHHRTGPQPASGRPQP